MGKMKELMINEMNRHIDMTSDLDWDAPQFDGAGFTQADNQLDPPPDQIDTETNKCMWIIKSIKDDVEYKIWADTYQQALSLLPLIESF
jgi:hypothetical protein